VRTRADGLERSGALIPAAAIPAAGQRPELEDAELCLALLDEAIARAQRWLACRERSLADFDVRAVDSVRRLHVAGMLAPSTGWNL
jgi:hypothetical protein